MKKKNKIAWSPLLLSNFMGVFNDNFLKFSIIFLAITWSIPSWLTHSQLVSLASLFLVLPYLLLSPLGGRLSILYPPKKVFLFFKIIEVPIIFLAIVAFYFQYVFLALFSVLLMGIQSSLYSPSKYSLIKEVGGKESVAYGTGMFEMMAFLGILLGTIVASFVSDNYRFIIFAGAIFLIAICGVLFTSLIKIPKIKPIETQPINVSINPFTFIVQSFKVCRQYKLLNAAVAGSALFWFIGSMLQMNIVIHGSLIYQLSNTHIGYIVSGVAVCLGVGSWLAGMYISPKNASFLMLVGLIGMTLILVFLGFFPLSLSIFSVLIALLAICGGLFQVTCLSMLQKNAKDRPVGDLFAYLNLVTFVLILIGSALFSGITWLFDQNSYYVFICMAIFSFLASIYYLFLAKKNQFSIFIQ
jgi:MFS family permease